MKDSSSIAPAAHHSALFFIHVGISEPELVPCEVGGIFKIFSLTRIEFLE